MAQGTRKRKRVRRRRRLRWLRAALRRLFRWTMLALGVVILAVLLWVLSYRWINPPGGFYMWQESRRLGVIGHEWVDLAQISPHMARSVVAAEDARFCTHWGFDMVEIRAALDRGAVRGASTISQQVVKNVFLWHGRTWTRKALEAVLTPVMETLWPKTRVLEVYLNIAEFGEGIFGVEAAAQHYFNRSAADLTARQAALLASVLPAPQQRDPTRPGDFLRRRAAAIEDGAATIARDGRAACFGG
jgi:monofunctional biosynthetic peptidoglycan transglycosylase